MCQVKMSFTLETAGWAFPKPIVFKSLHSEKGDFSMSTPENTQMNKQEPQGVPAVGFLVMAFTDETAGDQALQAMIQGKKEKTFYFEEAAVIRQDAAGKVHYKETGDIKSGKGAGIGALIGGIIGIFGGPGGVALGAGAGAAVGAAVSHGDAGFRDESLNTVGLALKPGTSAVVAITSGAFLKAVQKQVPVENIREFVKNLSQEISNRLNAGKSMALGVILTEGGLAMKEVAVDEKSTEVIVMAVNQDAALTASAVVTADGAAYEVAGATKDVAFMEAGVVTKDGAVIVDNVVTKDGEVMAVTGILPEEEAKEIPEKGEDSEAKSDPA
jgi:uncharacterized membrane protein